MGDDEDHSRQEDMGVAHTLSTDKSENLRAGPGVQFAEKQEDLGGEGDMYSHSLLITSIRAFF